MQDEITLEEWKEIGRKAKAVRDANDEFRSLLGKKLNKDIWQEQWFESEEVLRKLRSHLDGVVSNQFKDSRDSEISDIFYGDENHE